MTRFEKSMKTLELQEVLTLLAAQAISPMAKEELLSLTPMRYVEDIKQKMTETDDALHLMLKRQTPAFAGLKDLTAPIKRAQMGGVLNPSELLNIARLLRTARQMKMYSDGVERETSLDVFFRSLTANKYMEEKIDAAIISEDEISDSASTELLNIRRQMRATNNRVREVLHKIISGSNYSKYLQESIITMRADRYVVPVKAEFRGEVAGLVHDVSSSGATLFIEPVQVVEANNELKMLAGKEQKEIERILAELSAEVAGFSGNMLEDMKILTYLDCVFAKAKFALAIDAVAPQLTTDGVIDLIRAKHPLLDKKKAVPIDIHIGRTYDTLVITGPNTGGKTVALKTLGLLTLMVQCGLHIPVNERSSVSVYGKIFADIGDEQSISQSLSTFSSHMVNIVGILDEVDDHSLVLFDELGAGTDPVEGAALAMSIIENVRRCGAKIAATTHYAELKTYALTTAGVENAACEFDVETLRPTYRLLIGIPGKSNAFAISKRLGLRDDIIEEAKSSLNSESVKFEDILNDLERQRQQMEKDLAEADRARRDAEEERRRARQSRESIQRDKDRILDKAREDARAMLDETRETTEIVYAELETMRKKAQQGAFDENLYEAKAAVGRGLNETEGKLSPNKKPKAAPKLKRPLKAGDTVELLSTGTRATVVEVNSKGDSFILQAGILKINAKPGDVRLIEEEKTNVAQVIKNQAPAVRVNVGSKTMNATTEIDLRGMNGDEALIELSRFMDTAVMANIPVIRIIHGKGTGVLRSVIHTELRRDKRIKSFRLGQYGEGEHGVTVVEFR